MVWKLSKWVLEIGVLDDIGFYLVLLDVLFLVVVYVVVDGWVLLVNKRLVCFCVDNRVVCVLDYLIVFLLDKSWW